MLLFVFSTVRKSQDIPTQKPPHIHTLFKPQQSYQSVLYNKALVIGIPFNLCAFVKKH